MSGLTTKRLTLRRDRGNREPHKRTCWRGAGAELLGLLRDLYTDEEIGIWWEAPQPRFAGLTAWQMIEAGREADLILALRQMVEGVYV